MCFRLFNRSRFKNWKDGVRKVTYWQIGMQIFHRLSGGMPCWFVLILKPWGIFVVVLECCPFWDFHIPPERTCNVLSSEDDNHSLFPVNVV